MTKRRTYLLHVNKRGGHWTIHGAGMCIPAQHVTISGTCETVHKPLKKDNPRFFIKVKGYLRKLEGEGNYAIEEN